MFYLITYYILRHDHSIVSVTIEIAFFVCVIIYEIWLLLNFVIFFVYWQSFDKDFIIELAFFFFNTSIISYLNFCKVVSIIDSLRSFSCIYNYQNLNGAYKQFMFHWRSGYISSIGDLNLFQQYGFHIFMISV